jgi:hypothetical protein
MRKLPFCLLVALALGVGGCASAPPIGFCAQVSDLRLRQEWAPPLHRSKIVSVRPIAVAHHRPVPDVVVTATATRDDTPEPRFTSTEWWMRENARLGKAMIICRGCLPPRAANSLLPKPAVLTSTTDLPSPPSGSMDRFDEAPIQTQGEP